MLLVKRNLFVSYHFSGNKDQDDEPEFTGFGNRVMHVHAHVLSDDAGLRELEEIIVNAVMIEMKADDIEIVLLNWKWMGD